MQQLSWKNFPFKIEKSLCKLFGPTCAPNPVHNSVTIYSVKALSMFLCEKEGFAAPAARRLTRPLAPATVGVLRSIVFGDYQIAPIACTFLNTPA